MAAFNDVSAESTVALAATVDADHLKYLAVLVRSALDHLARGWKLRVFVLGYKIDADVQRRFADSSFDERLQIEWRSPDLEMIRGRWPGATGGGVVLYYRLYLGEILPSTLRRVLFLDADTLATGDLSELWRSSFEAMTVQAVPDAYAHVMHVERLEALELPADVRLDASAGYFNAGVLLIDLERWRREQVSARATSLMWTHGDDLLGRDQDALNLVLAGRWKPLSVAWNFHELPGSIDSWRAPADDDASLRQAVAHPRIIHFIGCKPWAADCLHHGREQWREVARAVGMSTPSPGVWFRWFRAPLYDFGRRWWRGIVDAQGLLMRPWLLVAYPCWATWRRLRRLRRARAKVG